MSEWKVPAAEAMFMLSHLVWLYFVWAIWSFWCRHASCWYPTCTWALVRAQTLSNRLFDAGLHPSIKSGQPPVLVTTGLGETALPMRLFNPPVIDILKLE